MIDVFTNIVVCLAITTNMPSVVKCETCGNGFTYCRREETHYIPFEFSQEELNKCVALDEDHLYRSAAYPYGRRMEKWPQAIPITTYTQIENYDAKFFHQKLVGILFTDKIIEALPLTYPAKEDYVERMKKIVFHCPKEEKQ